MQTFSAVTIVVFLSACDLGTPTEVTGQWEGTYTCAQGLTGLTLTLGNRVVGYMPAVFSFYAVPSNPGVPSGSFRMDGRLDGHRLVLTAGEWITQPVGYRTVDLDGIVTPDGQTYVGDVIGGLACTTFSLSKMGID